MQFFETMRKAERIIQDARVLMAGEDGPTKIGSVFENKML